MEISERKPVGLTGRYINALYKLCLEKNVIEKVVLDFENLKKIFLKNEEIKHLISSPTIGKSNQTKAIVNILKEAGAHNITINFCGVLSQNGRITILYKIVDGFLQEVSRRNGEVNIEVVSAYELDESK